MRKSTTKKMTPEEEKNHHHVLFTATLIFVVLGGFVIVLFFNSNIISEVVWKMFNAELNSEAIIPSIKATNVILVKNQPLGPAANISTVRLVEPGFILLMRIGNKDGVIYTAVGASNYLETGTYSNIKVNFYVGKEWPLVESSDSLLAILVKAGSDKRFENADFKNPITGMNSALLAVKFTVF